MVKSNLKCIHILLVFIAVSDIRISRVLKTDHKQNSSKVLNKTAIPIIFRSNSIIVY